MAKRKMDQADFIAAKNRAAAKGSGGSPAVAKARDAAKRAKERNEETEMDEIDHVANMVANVRAKNMIGAEQEFNSALQDRLEVALDVRRREIAGAIYGGKPADINADDQPPEDIESEAEDEQTPDEETEDPEGE